MRYATRTMLALVSAVLLLAAGLAAQRNDSAQALLRAATDTAVVDGDLNGAIEQFQTIVDRFKTDRSVVATALVRMAECYQKLGDAESRKIYERVVREFADQAESATTARTRLAALTPPGGPTNPSGVVVRQVWAGPDVDVTGALSPDGQSLTFVDWVTGDLAVRNLATGTDRRLTNKGSWSESSEYAINSIVSPDGKQVAYLWQNKKRGDPTKTEPLQRWDLRIISLGQIGDAKPRVVFDNEDVDYIEPHAWSPDGRQVLAVLQRADSTNQIALLSVADGSAQVLKSLEWRWPEKVSFSPNGRYIAYDVPTRQDSSDRDIFMLSIDGSRETPLIQHRATDRSPIWTPDGKSILFESDRSGTMGVWMIGVENGTPAGGPVLVKPNAGQIGPLGFAPDGSLYYSVRTGADDIFTIEMDPATGKIVRTPAPATERFLGSNLSPSWSPDGRYLAYFSRRGSGGFALGSSPQVFAIVIRDVRTGEEHDFLPRLDLNERSPMIRWFPDGRSLVVPAVDSQGRWSLYRMDAQTGGVSLVWRAEGRGHWSGSPFPAVSPDGRTLYYHDFDSSKSLSAIVAHEGRIGAVKELYRTAPGVHTITALALSKDGRELAFVLYSRNGTSSLHTMPVTGGEVRELLRGERLFLALAHGGIEWTPDGRYLLVARQTPESDTSRVLKSALWRVPVAGGEPQLLLATEHSADFLSMHPDGRRIAFSTGPGYRVEVWMMENFLPALKAAR